MNGAQDFSSMSRSNMLGMGWATESTSPIWTRGCLILLLIFVAIPIIQTILIQSSR